MNKIKKSIWDVSLEEDDRTTLPANDCRRFNGGEVADSSVTRNWPKAGEENREPSAPKVLAIDRLRI